VRDLSRPTVWVAAGDEKIRGLSSNAAMKVPNLNSNPEGGTTHGKIWKKGAAESQKGDARA
jgi:hypothetical protein